MCASLSLSLEGRVTCSLPLSFEGLVTCSLSLFLSLSLSLSISLFLSLQERARRDAVGNTLSDLGYLSTRSDRPIRMSRTTTSEHEVHPS